ncbi:hypothetical protein [Ottowia testudinis]|uniref:Uncharacterized protein n=1 Tax=Ottowia testudinis TaxID=2816950 RepID=A0A975CI07_9BURK|nr:hypothetical protein [Ottowia testudinis]QTD43753.1 hypothetical protein J1M35_11335 [Ottowia testudinis]
MGLDLSAAGIMVMLLTAAASFALGRWLSRGWREKRRAKNVAAARAAETRQQRRARERQGRRR